MFEYVVIFDSGLGGLSVYQEIQKRYLNYHILYIADNLYLPYGELEDQVLIDRVVAIVRYLMRFIGIKLVVIACNTASTIVLPQLRCMLAIDIVGVVPAIKVAVDQTKTGVIGLLATPATIKRQYIQDLYDRYASHCQLIKVGSSELVLLAEQKIIHQKIDNDSLLSIVEPFVLHQSLDVVVLGCTHFHFLEQDLQKVLGQEKILLDSSVYIANRVESLLEVNEKRYQCYHCFISTKGYDNKVYQILSNYFFFHSFSVVDIV